MKSSVLKDASRAGLYHLSVARQALFQEQAGRAHLTLLKAELGTCRDLVGILNELGKALQFPIWYGSNLDALNDCLSDPDWHKGQGLAIIIGGLDALRQHDPEDFANLLEVLTAGADARSQAGAPLWILLTTPARGIAALPEA